MAISPPRTEEELLQRLRPYLGRNIEDIAKENGITVPLSSKSSKGWVGQVMETLLGATASSRPEPDFPGLGIEMKTIPVTLHGKPKESTYVSTVPLDGSLGTQWHKSWVRRKLSHVLWVPMVQQEGGQRLVGQGFLWRPDGAEEEALRRDWERVAAFVATGDFGRIQSRDGEVLQVRPKAADSEVLTWVVDSEGEWAQQRPLGFYLRPSFTETLLQKLFFMG